MKIGDYVVRKKYNKDIVFQIYAIKENLYYLKGVEYRLLADAFEEDLEVVDLYRVKQTFDFQLNQGVLKGKILHLDGDETYLKICEEQYERLNARSVCLHIKQKDMATCIQDLLYKYQPDLLVITGHDALNEEGDYSHSSEFVACVKQARLYEKNKDQLIIFAGACQSDYERLIAAGANFASSPKRVNIHALDPVNLMSQISSVSVKEYIDLEAITKYTTCKMDGIGGIDTKGVARSIYPRKEPL